MLYIHMVEENYIGLYLNVSYHLELHIAILLFPNAWCAN